MVIPSRGIRFVVAVCTLLVAGCAKYATAESAAAQQQIGLDIQPSAAQLVAGGTVNFAAVVTGAANAAVNWSVVEAGGGTIDGAGLYTAPQTAGTFHVRASIVADPTVQATAPVTVAPPGTVAVTVAVSPATGAVHSCETLSFSATVTGASDTTVSWSVQEGAAGGSIDANGVYTAPNTAGTFHVVATSRADPTRNAIAQVNVTALVLSIAVSPSPAQVVTGGSMQFTATVRTTCGAFTAAKTIVAAGTQ